MPKYGCQGVWNQIHHKNNIDKLLVICASAVAPFDNALRKGRKEDAAMFPSLAKDVLAIGGQENDGRQLAGDKIWEALEKAWRAYPADKIARLYAHHAQVAAAIYA